MQKFPLILIIVLVVLPITAGAQDYDSILKESEFDLNTTDDLYQVCNVPAEDPLAIKALYFCLGFVTGVGHYHHAISLSPDIEPLTCPDKEPTRVELAIVFLKWAEAHPEFKDIPPEDGLMRAAAEKWPCNR